MVSENTPWNGGYVAVNSFGFGGANAHVILKSNPKPKPISPPLENGPRVVAISGRTEEAVKEFLTQVRTSLLRKLVAKDGNSILSFNAL